MHELKNKHVTRLRYPTSPGGALYYVTDQEGLCQMAVDLVEFQYLQNGTRLPPELRAKIERDVRFERTIYNSELADLGVPEKLSTLFQLSKKSDVEQYCRTLTISEFELFLLIRNCHLIGYSHKSKFPEYIPDHLVITDSDTAKLKEGNIGPASKKLGPLLDERRHINVHMFCNESDWHCFFFSYEDIEEDEKNHWKHGSHVHYISHLWPNFTKEQVWEAFEIRKTKLSSSLHIRCDPYVYPKMQTPDDYPVSTNDSPGSFAFDLSLTSDSSSFPIPSAHLATRGVWITTVSIPNT